MQWLSNKSPSEKYPNEEMGNNFGAEFKAAHPDEVGPDGVVKVCIGGGAGFIGSHIAKKLMAEVTAPTLILMHLFHIDIS